MLVMGLAHSCDTGTTVVSPTGIPALLEIVTGQAQHGTVGKELFAPLRVRVLDAESRPVSGQIVNFKVVSGGGSVYAGQPPSGYRNPSEVGRTSIVHVLVGAVDDHHERAKAEGATITEELVDLPFGHRRYSCRDPQGHEWAFAEVIRA